MVQFNLSDLLEQLGEGEVKSILSSFSCPINADVERFLKTNAIEFSKRGFSKTHLVFWATQDGSEIIQFHQSLLLFNEVRLIVMSKKVERTRNILNKKQKLD